MAFIRLFLVSTLLAAPIAAEDVKWDVAAPLGPTTALDFETSEGTWMNVDVSPDGKRVIFDLVGDLYLIPIEGGRATRITSGPAFDVQPRFSPDGRRIAFTSDRDGMWNIWTVDPEGKNPRQISKETERGLNSPTWSPDGQFIYARRHFVKERSLGSGEIWMYHASGAKGLQVTEKPSWQKDAGEPAISPDGKYLYYSKDVTPGQNFEYNKDPNGVIYAVIRRDLVDGKEKTLIRVEGGATTPRPSPDGKTLAFVRRVRLKSVLFLHDLATGEKRPIFDRLDRDLQEAWSIHGVYPQYAWLSDGKSIVIWGQGKIWRVDVDGKRSVEIPFTARVEQTVNDALRFPQAVHPPEFPVRMLRDVATSPDGSTVAYSALGRVYVKQLPNGEPRRLTTDQRIELDPAFSRDGRFLVYATWTDRDRGRIRKVRADGSGGVDLVTTPGHYTEPAFSPDGARVVYRSVNADGVRDVAFGEDSGIFIVDAEGEPSAHLPLGVGPQRPIQDGKTPPRKVRDVGVDPQFDPTGARIYARERRGEKFVLVSTDLEGGHEIVHFQSDNATQIVPSPDGNWVAFVERFKAYVAAFPKTGRTIDLGPKVDAYPVAQISRDAGMYLHWSGDSKKVYWALGPELFSRDLVKTFSFVEQGLETPASPETAGTPIGFTMKSDAPSGSIALTGARIVTMGSGAVIERGTVLVEGNRIAAVGPTASVRVPSGATVINVAGKTLIPGLVDVHAHVGSEGDGILAELNWPLAANLAYGITTSHDPSNDTEVVFTNAEMIRAGMKLGPRLFSTGTVLYGAETPFKAVVETYEDALSHLRRMKAVGAFSVKSYNQLRRDARQMILKAARELQMMVVPEGGSLVYVNETMVLDGHTGVEHSLPVPVVYKDVATLFGKSKTGYTPTLIVGYGGLSGEYYWYQHTNVWENERLLAFTPREVIDERSRRRTMAPEDDFNHIAISKGAKAILDAGGLVQLGAHGQLQGLGAHWELWMLEQGGMTPLEALRCATLNGAKYLGLDADVGSIEKGKLADLVVLDKNPLESIRNTESVNSVMMNGRLYDAATLDEVAPRKTKRPTFYWER